MKLRLRNALASGAASFLALLAMALWVGGTHDFMGAVTEGIYLFLAISSFAVLLGAFLSTTRVWWSLMVCALSGIVGGCVILLLAVSNI
jgi:hypothetical protein